MRIFVTLVFAVLAGCYDVGSYPCTSNANCISTGMQGTCIASGNGSSYCAFTDGACASGLRWHRSAAEGVAGMCVTSVMADMSTSPQPDMSMPMPDMAHELQCALHR